MNQLPDNYNKNPEQAAVLKIMSGTHKGKQFRLLGSRITVGRSSQCDLIFKNNRTVSKEHALISYEEGHYFIKTLNPNNPVLVNGKKVDLCHLQPRNKISIGDIEFVFEEKSPLPSLYTNPEELKKQQKSLKNPPKVNIVRIALVAMLVLAGVLFLSEGDKNKDTQVKLKTQQEVDEELEILKKISEEDIQSSKVTSESKVARIAFIKGFRDYRKGYFQRALKAFRHCLTLDKNYSHCRSYIEKSNIQIEKLIQQKMQLGKRYQENKQYGACKAIFKSVTTMIQDINSSVYKEALLNRRWCDSKTKNKI